MLLELWPLQTFFSSPCTLEVGDVVPEILSLLLHNKNFPDFWTFHCIIHRFLYYSTFGPHSHMLSGFVQIFRFVVDCWRTCCIIETDLTWIKRGSWTFWWTFVFVNQVKLFRRHLQEGDTTHFLVLDSSSQLPKSECSSVGNTAWKSLRKFGEKKIHDLEVIRPKIYVPHWPFHCWIRLFESSCRRRWSSISRDDWTDWSLLI